MPHGWNSHVTSQLCALCHELFNESHSVALTKCTDNSLFLSFFFFLVLVNSFVTVATPLSGIRLESANICQFRIKLACCFAAATDHELEILICIDMY